MTTSRMTMIELPQLSGVDRARALIEGKQITDTEVVIDCRQVRALNAAFANVLLLGLSAQRPKQISVRNLASTEMAGIWTTAALDTGVMLADVAFARPMTGANQAVVEALEAVADRLAALEAGAADAYRRDRDSYNEGKRDAYDLAESVVRDAIAKEQA